MRVIHNVIYATGYVAPADGTPGTMALGMDIYLPAEPDATPRPALLLVHGGGFTEGDRSQMAGLAEFFVARGFVCFANDYRLRRDIPDATPAAAMADTLAAIRWVRKHATEYGARPDAIGALGYSAGAFAVLATATGNDADFRPDGKAIAPFNTPGVSSRVRAAVIVSGGLFGEDALDPSDPPLLVIHGLRDQVVPVERGRAIQTACAKKGIHCEFVPIDRADHWPLNGDYQGRNVKEYAADFLHKYLDPPAEVPVAAEPEAAMPPNPAQRPVEGVVDPAVTYSLDTSGTTHGTVECDPPGGVYPAGTVVKLTAIPAAQYRFGYWAGDVRAIQTTCYVTVDRNRIVEAGFVPREDAERVTLQHRVQGNGRLVIEPPLTSYVKGDTVAFTAVPERGARFLRWEGDLSGEATQTTLAMNDDKRIAAVFETVLAPEPDAVLLGPGGGSAAIRVGGASKGWTATPLWPVTGADFERGADDTVGISCLPNPTAYPRTTLLRLTAPALGKRYVDVPVVQQGASPFPPVHRPGEQGLAIYMGLPGEAGRIVWWSAPGVVEDGLINANGDGTFTLAAQRGTAIGVLTVDGEQALRVPSGSDFHVYAEWDLPENPTLLADPDVPDDNRTSYCYVGIDADAVNRSALRFGIEWKNMGAGDEWVLRGQFGSRDLSARAQNGGDVPRHVRVHVWKSYAAGRDKAVIRAEYRLDDGPWQPYAFAMPDHPDAYPMGALGEDHGDDLVTIKVRGLASTRFGGLRVSGALVPPVNLGLDADGDGVPNERDTDPATKGNG